MRELSTPRLTRGGAHAGATLALAVALALAACSGPPAGRHGLGAGDCGGEGGGHFQSDPTLSWHRVEEWRTTSPPRDPPSDRTVTVTAQLSPIRTRGPVPSRLTTHDSIADDVERAMDLDGEILIAEGTQGDEAHYITVAVLIETDRVSFMGNCAHQNVTEPLEERFGKDQVGPLVREFAARGPESELGKLYAQPTTAPP